jgi:adenine-specific DNA-methyltransferase
MPKNDYSSWSKEDLIKKINALEKRKKYGLVWDAEREPERVVLDCQKELPVLKEIKKNEIHSDKTAVTHIEE